MPLLPVRSCAIALLLLSFPVAALAQQDSSTTDPKAQAKFDKTKARFDRRIARTIKKTRLKVGKMFDKAGAPLEQGNPDLNSNGQMDEGDVTIATVCWMSNVTGVCAAADVDNDGSVGIQDLNIVLSSFPPDPSVLGTRGVKKYNKLNKRTARKLQKIIDRMAARLSALAEKLGARYQYSDVNNDGTNDPDFVVGCWGDSGAGICSLADQDNDNDVDNEDLNQALGA